MSSALTTTEQGYLSAFQAGVLAYLWYVPDITVATATITALLSPTLEGTGPTVPSIAGFTVSGTSAGWANIAPGQTVYVGSTPGAKDVMECRVRKPGDSATLYVNEVSTSDIGFLNRSTQIPLAVGQYVTIVTRRDIWTVLPRILYAGMGTTGTIYEDYDLGVGTVNKYPPPVVRVTINGIANHYSDLNFTNASIVTLVFLATVEVWPTSASATYSWTLPGAFTVTGGGITTPTVTVTAPTGAYYSVSLLVTENNGNSAERDIDIWLGSSSFQPIAITDVLNDVRDRTGRTISFGLNDNLFSVIPEGTKVQYCEYARWGGNIVASATTRMNGWLVRQNDPIQPGLRRAEPQIVGPAGLLQMLGGYSQYFQVVTTPSNWQQVAPSLDTIHFITWYMAYWRMANILKLFDWNPLVALSSSGTNGVATVFAVDAANGMQALQNLAQQKAALIGCDSSGSFWFRRHPSMIDPSLRSSVVIRGTIDETIYSSGVLSRNLRPSVNSVRGEGFYNDGTTNHAQLSDAPGAAPGQGPGATKLPKQTIEGQSDLNMLSGQYFQMQNNPWPDVKFTIQSNYDVFEPAELYRVQAKVPSYLRPDATQWTNYIILNGITKHLNGDGTANIDIDAEAETAGSPGITVPVPLPQTIYPASPIYNPIVPVISPIITPPPPPPGGDPIPLDGNACIVWDATDNKVWVTRNFRIGETSPGTNPTYTDITPSSFGSFTIKDVQIDPQSGTKGSVWLLASDGTNSYVWYTVNAFAGSVVWVKGGQLIGVYTSLRLSNVAGTIMAYAPNVSNGGSTTYDFTTSNQGFVLGDPAGIGTSGGVWTSLQGWQSTGVGGGPDAQVTIYKVVSTTLQDIPTTAQIMIATAYSTLDDTGYSYTLAYRRASDGVWFTAGGGIHMHTTPDPYNFTAGGTVVVIDRIEVSFDYGFGNPTITIPQLQIGVTSLSGAYVATSANNGSTWLTLQHVGAAPTGSGGFDSVRIGASSIATSALQANYATTAGGAYTPDSTGGVTAHDPLCLEAPLFRLGSTTVVNSSGQPDYLIATADGLFKVGAGHAAIDISPVVGGVKAVGFASNDIITTWYGNQIAVDLSLGGTRTCFTSVDTGNSWINRGSLNANAGYIRYKRVTGTGQLFGIANYANLKYTLNNGTTFYTVNGPDTHMIGLEFWG